MNNESVGSGHYTTPVVIFDLYGTLILTHQNGKAWTAWQEHLAEYVRRLGGDAKADTVAELPADFWDDDHSADTNTTVFERRLEKLLERLSLTVSADELRLLANGLCDVWQEGMHFDPAIYEILPLFEGRTGLVTNFDHPPHVRKLLKENELDGFFKSVIISGETGILKPDPGMLIAACRELDCLPGQAAYVGDSIVDYEAAKGAGMRPVLIKREGQITPWGRRGGLAPPFDIANYITERAELGELEIIQHLTEIPALLQE